MLITASHLYIPSELALDTSLSPKAFRILIWLLSQSEEALKEITSPKICEVIGGWNSSKKAIAELRHKGYLKWEAQRGEKGRLSGGEYHVFDTPNHEPELAPRACADRGACADREEE
jgi:hypothetical protein